MSQSMTPYNLEYDENLAREEATDVVVQSPLKRTPKKKSGAFGIFKAALYMMRKRTDEKEAKNSKAKSKGSNGDWRKIVESMRPLHVQQTPESPVHMRIVHESPMHMMSPASDCFTAASSSGTISQYASAANLRDLYNSDDEDQDGERNNRDEVFEAINGDEMIDAKADEFIAQFYKQIHHQNSINRLDRGV